MPRPRLSDDSETKRLHMVIAEDQLREIDDFATQHGINRSEAIRALVGVALEISWLVKVAA